MAVGSLLEAPGSQAWNGGTWDLEMVKREHNLCQQYCLQTYGDLQGPRAVGYLGLSGVCPTPSSQPCPLPFTSQLTSMSML